MALSTEDMARIKHEQLGGLRSATAWNDALNALHTFAQLSDCPPGYDVITWFRERSDAYATALNAAIRDAAERPASSDVGSANPKTEDEK